MTEKKKGAFWREWHLFQKLKQRQRFFEIPAKNLCFFSGLLLIFEHFHKEVVLKDKSVYPIIPMESLSLSTSTDTHTVKSVEDLFVCVKGSGQRCIYHIDQCIIPYVFHFNETLLNNCQIAPETAVKNPLASDIFKLLKERITPRRKTSRSGRTPTRMKYEQKIKFVMRSLETNVARIYNRSPRKLTKFNVQEQRQFFSNFEIQKHFLNQMPKIIEEKRKANEDKIKQTEGLISDVLLLSRKDPQMGRKIFNTQIKQRQLPWTQQMFKDIKEFFHFVYREFISGPSLLYQSSQKSCDESGNSTKAQKWKTKQHLFDNNYFEDIILFDQEQEEVSVDKNPLQRKKQNSFLQASLNESETTDTNSLKHKGQIP